MEKSNFSTIKEKCIIIGTQMAGLDPLDFTIKSTIRHAYSHHIEG